MNTCYYAIYLHRTLPTTIHILYLVALTVYPLLIYNIDNPSTDGKCFAEIGKIYILINWVVMFDHYPVYDHKII